MDKEELFKEYPTMAKYIYEAVDEHGEEWVLDNYYTKFYPAGVVLQVPDKDELPFFDEVKHETLTGEEKTEMYSAWNEYRENLRTGTKPG